MKKVLFILASAELGGAEKQAIILASEIIKQNIFLVEFVLFDDFRGAASDRLSEKNIKTYFCKPISSKYLLITWFRIFKYWQLLLKISPDYLLPYTYYPNIYSCFLSKYIRENKCIWNQRDEGIGFNQSFITRKALSRADYFIANSKNAREFLLHLNIPSEKIAIIQNGFINTTVKTPRSQIRRSLNIEEETLICCMISNITPYKDHDTLLKAWKIVCDTLNDRSLVLLLVGRLGSTYESLVSLAAKLSITSQILFMGPTDDINQILNAVDLSVLSSRSEGLPNVLIETMFAKVPFTGTNIPGIVNVLGNDYSQYLSEPGNCQDMAEKIIWFIRNPIETNELAQRNFNILADKYSSERLLKDTVMLLETNEPGFKEEPKK